MSLTNMLSVRGRVTSKCKRTSCTCVLYQPGRVCGGPQVCVWLELSEVKWDSGLHGVKGVLWVSSRRLLTDSGVGRRALALTAWVQLACPLPGTCPGTVDCSWPGAGASAKGAGSPAPGPGTWFGPGQGWGPCGIWVWRRPRRNNRDPIEGAKI